MTEHDLGWLLAGSDLRRPKMRRMTVSELIRESKPDWEPVRTRGRRTSTRAFSGCPQVDASSYGASFADQMAESAEPSWD